MCYGELCQLRTAYSESLVVDCSHYMRYSKQCWLQTAITVCYSELVVVVLSLCAIVSCVGCGLPSLCAAVSCWLWTALTMHYSELYWLRTAITVRYNKLLVVDCSHYAL